MSTQTFAPPPGVSGPTYTVDQIRAIIDQEAAARGVPAPLAEAVSFKESGFNPYAIGDNGTSFGEDQLHVGGELDNLPGSLSQRIAAAFDPKTNVDVALGELASVYAADPNADPGQIAAAAQRPADRAGYAAAIDSILSGGTTRSSSSSGSAQNAGLLGAHGWNPLAWPGQILDAGISGVWDQVQPFLVTGMFAVGAIALVVIGAKQLVQPTADKVEEKVKQGAETAAKAGAVAAA